MHEQIDDLGPDDSNLIGERGVKGPPGGERWPNGPLMIAVYAIAKDEEQIAERFAAAVSEADEVFVGLDAASSDRTGEILRAAGFDVRPLDVKPWRFDQGRNTVLSWVPEWYDVCFAVDIDEVPQAGWAAKVRQAWSPGVNFLWSQLVQSRREDGSPGLVFDIKRIHGREGWTWRYPMHEALFRTDGDNAQQATGDRSLDGSGAGSGVIIDHLHKSGRVARDDFYLYELALKEFPDDARVRHYVGRQCYYLGRIKEAVEHLKAHLAMPSARWAVERAASCRLIADCAKKASKPYKAREWYLAACRECDCRESWLDLAILELGECNWALAYWAARIAGERTTRENHYLSNGWYWAEGPHDIVAVAAHFMGKRDEARHEIAKALSFNPDCPRLKRNWEMIADGHRVSVPSPRP